MSSFVESPSRSITLTLTFTLSLSLSLSLFTVGSLLGAALSDLGAPTAREDLGANSALVFTKEMPTTDASSGTAAGRSTRPSRTSADTSRRPCCALRTLKAELGCGMAPDQTARAAADDQWQVNGKFGVIQVAPPCVSQ